jgi:hypothetical protein
MPGTQYGLDEGLTLKGHGSGRALKGRAPRTATGAFRRGAPAMRLQAQAATRTQGSETRACGEEDVHAHRADHHDRWDHRAQD